MKTIILMAALCIANVGCTKAVRQYTKTCDVVSAKVRADVASLPEDWQVLMLQWQEDRNATGIPNAKEISALALRFRDAGSMEDRKELIRAILAEGRALKDAVKD